MGAETKIAWTDHTFNPWWGCARVSPGCEHCYAETFAKRTGHRVWGVQAERRRFGDKHWEEPLAWNAAALKASVRRRVFCASMADVFEDRRDLDAERLRLWALIDATPALDWLLLTKRPENLRTFLPSTTSIPPRPNVWLGTTVEDQRRADERIPHLLSVPAAVRFLSCEPLLEAVDLTRIQIAKDTHEDVLGDGEWRGEPEAPPGIDWVIVGGESGPMARPFDLAWARSIVEQCRDANVPVFVKQLGARPFDSATRDGEFTSFHRWVNQAKSWIGGTGAICVDAKGRHCPSGAEFMRARDEGAFPVSFHFPPLIIDRAGADPSEWPEDLKVREFPEVCPC